MPLAFIAFFFSWTLQVLTGSGAFGVVPYVFLLVTMMGIFARAMFRKRVRWGVHGMNNLDFFVLLFVLLSSVHALLALAIGGYAFADVIRILLISVGSAWIYAYISRYSKESGIRAIMVIIAISTLIVSVEWIYETFSRLILHKVVDFQIKNADYLAMRKNTSIRAEQVSVSKFLRSFGLFDSYTTTGPMVALGAFAAPVLFADSARATKIRVMALYFVVLLIGMATTALVSYILILPFLIAFMKEKWRISGILMRMAMAFLAFIIIASIALFLFQENPFANFIISNASLQLRILTNLDDAQGISWLQMYVRNLGWFYDFIAQKPIAVLFGEGVLNYGQVTYMRGSDVGLLEFVSAYGIPFSILFFTACLGAMRRAVKSLKRSELTSVQKMYMLFSFGSMAFLMLSFFHYDILFEKSVTAMFFLSLGLIRRYGYRTKSRYELSEESAGGHLLPASA